jgi:deoxyribodipyrimidine photolyase-related protein
MSKNLLLILGNQLFPEKYLKDIPTKDVVMIEDYDLCTHFQYHQQKIVLFLSAMREYASSLKDNYQVHYHQLTQNIDLSFEEKLKQIFDQKSFKKLYFFEIEDQFFEKRILHFLKDQKIDFEIISSPMFLCSREDFRKYLDQNKKPFMKTFYEGERVKRNILMEDNGKPRGGKFSFDAENRKKLPKNHTPPEIKQNYKNDTINEVIKLTKKEFPKHPGCADDFWWPTNRNTALSFLDDFLENRFHNFGVYEDAISTQYPFIYHSLLSPLINLGLITPQEVIDKAIDYADQNKIPLNSLEGFIRQIMGWREFIRGIYQNFDEDQNFWNHQRKLNSKWYEGKLGIKPVDDAIKKALKYGYNHHIERLMILSNFMLLCEIDPEQVYKWFMEMYVDSSDWVMEPNVYGMGQFSDGGIFATKPYICGSNYILKMSNYKKDSWCEIFDGLYWRFINKHQDFFKKNYRMKMMVNLLNKMDNRKRKNHLKVAEDFLKDL